MSVLARRNPGPFFDLFDWLESPLAVLRPVGGGTIPVEDYLKDGSYVLRAELPGVDPEKDVDITVCDGILTIRAHKHEEAEGKHHSEFRYGEFTRSISLPPEVDEDHIQAAYGHGVLEVTVALKKKEEEKPQRRIPVTLT